MARNHTELDLIRLAIREQLLDVHTMIPAKVEKYDSLTQKATVVVSINRGINNTVFPPAKLFNVKVAFPRMGDRGVSYEVKTGDSVLLGFAHRDLTKWTSAGEGFGPNSNDICPLSSAVVIAGLSPDLQNFTQKQGVTELVGSKLFLGDPKAVGPTLTAQVFPTVPPAVNPAGNPVLAAPALSPTVSKQYGVLNLDLVSLLIAAIENIVAAGYGTDTTAAGIISIGQMDPLSSANLESIVEALNKLKASN